MIKMPEGALRLEEILVDTAKMPWREKSLKGISEKMLWRNEETGASIALIKFAKGADAPALAAIGDEFRPGMVFAMNIDLFDPKWRNGETGCVFAETIVITDDGARRLHSFSTDFQRLPV